jgi:hypothetical protein
VNWATINALCIFSPLILLWGWLKFLKSPTRLDWRSRASLLGLSAPLLSVTVWAAMFLLARIHAWHTSSSAIQHLIGVGVWIPVLGMLIGFAGRPSLIVAIVPTCIATVLFWYGTTLP